MAKTKAKQFIKPKLCFCKSLKFMLTMTRINGFTHITSYHDPQGLCHFKTSKGAIWYTSFLCLVPIWCVYKNISMIKNHMMFISMLIILYKCMAPVCLLYIFIAIMTHRDDLIDGFTFVSRLPVMHLFCSDMLANLKTMSRWIVMVFFIVAIIGL